VLGAAVLHAVCGLSANALRLCCGVYAALQGVDTVFAYPGGASMEIHQALTRSETISNILCRHEQVRQVEQQQMQSCRRAVTAKQQHLCESAFIIGASELAGACQRLLADAFSKALCANKPL
jgi:hypothetical protein